MQSMSLDIFVRLIPGITVAFVGKLGAATISQDSHANRMDSSKSLEMYGWEAGIRTPIGRSRVCSPTVRRPPNGSALLEVPVLLPSCQADSSPLIRDLVLPRRWECVLREALHRNSPGAPKAVISDD
jgi:hypothetical protein